MKKPVWYNDSRALTMTSPGLIDRRIREAIKDFRPLDIELLRTALAIESSAPGSRIEVIYLLKREIARQEKSEQKVAA